MIVKFWGVRGSIPVPGNGTARTGGNTSCLQIVGGDDTIILDCGTGIRGLGEKLVEQSRQRPIHILLSHTHWDHIQGLPFFAPLYRSGQQINIYGPKGLERTLEEAVLVQLQRLYFPIRRSEVSAELNFYELGEDTLDLNGLRIRTKWMNHPVLTLGFRLSEGPRSLIYTGDNEPWDFYHIYAPASANTVKISLSGTETAKRRAALLAFLKEADLMVADAQYSDEEYKEKVGWGHSPISYVSDLAIEARIGRVVLFHHDPTHSDSDLDKMLAAARARIADRNGSAQVSIAREGDEITP